MVIDSLARERHGVGMRVQQHRQKMSAGRCEKKTSHSENVVVGRGGKGRKRETKKKGGRLVVDNDITRTYHNEMYDHRVHVASDSGIGSREVMAICVCVVVSSATAPSGQMMTHTYTGADAYNKIK